MRKYLLFASLALALGGCSTTFSGDGQLTDGSSIVGSSHVDINTGIMTVVFVSPQGWKCTGSDSTKRSPGQFASVPIPLTCSNGAHGRGEATIVKKGPYQTIIMPFRLNNGVQGSVSFPIVG